MKNDSFKIRIVDNGESSSLEVSFWLNRFGFPVDALVFVEAYRQREYMRFGWGSVGAISPPENRELSAFDRPEDILFRIKVVDASGEHGKILGEADQIRPTIVGKADDRRVPLLPVKPEDLGEEVCRVEYDSNRVRLLVNSRIPECKVVANSPLFISTVLPLVLREILNRAFLHEDSFPDYDDMSDWRSKWLRFATNLPGMDEFDPGFDEDKIVEWIDDAIKSFCRKHSVLTSFNNKVIKRGVAS